MSFSAVTSITKNTMVMMSSQLITWVSSFILMMFLPRYLASEDYGRLYLAISIGMIFQIVIEFGGNYFIPKEISRHPGRAASLAMNFIGIRTGLWACSVIVMIVLAYVAGYSGQVRILILIIGIAKLWEGAGGVLRNCMQGFEKMEYASLAIIAERLFLTLVGVTALLMGAHAITIAIIMG